MGVAFGDLIPREEVSLEFFSGKKIAVDAYNTIYQFLSIIRQKDGTPLMDSKGRITSHLSGLFYRSTQLLSNNIKPVYIFDGVPPEIKTKTLEKRAEIKQKAEVGWKEALEVGDLEEARKYAQATSKLTPEMVEDSKRLLDALGIPYIVAKEEGEAQAAVMCQKGDVFVCASQDWDSLLFGAPRLVRYLSITGRKKLPMKNLYIETPPQLIVLEKALSELKINRNQLIWMAIMIGTDYNEGIKGIGPKKSLKIAQSAKSLSECFKLANAEVENAEEIEKMFLNPSAIENYLLEWKTPNEAQVIKILCEEHDFSLERVRSSLKKVCEKLGEKTSQSGLSDWF